MPSGYPSVSASSSDSAVFPSRSASLGSRRRSSENDSLVTVPSTRAAATMYGSEWSAVSRVFGAHFSGSLAMIS